MNDKIEVEVLYADNSSVIVPMAEAETLLLDAVLALSVRNASVEGKRQNIAVSFGYDNYALCQGVNNGQPWVEIYPWDDGDYVQRRTNNHQDIDARTPMDVPLGCWHMIFRGQQVPDVDWAEALRIMDKEIL